MILFLLELISPFAFLAAYLINRVFFALVKRNGLRDEASFNILFPAKLLSLLISIWFSQTKLCVTIKARVLLNIVVNDDNVFLLVNLGSRGILVSLSLNILVLRGPTILLAAELRIYLSSSAVNLVPPRMLCFWFDLRKGGLLFIFT